jgi:hypothetical protein
MAKNLDAVIRRLGQAAMPEIDANDPVLRSHTGRL